MMNSLFRACSAAILSRTGDFVARSSLRGLSTPPWKHGGIRTINVELLLTRFRVLSYSSKTVGESKKRSRRKLDSKQVVKEERDVFFVVRKGDLVGVYKDLSECQAQVGSSLCDPPVSVFQGYSMPHDTAEYLLSCGLTNALYSIRAANLKDDLFGTLVPCALQEPSSSNAEILNMDMPDKWSQEEVGAETVVSSRF